PQRGHIPPPPGVITPSPTLPVIGPLAPSAADLRAALQVMGGPDDEEGRAYRWSLPPARATRLSEYRIGYLIDDPACAVSADEREVLVRAIDGLLAAGVKLEEGWPKGVEPLLQWDTYLTLFHATFAAGLTDDQIDGLRRRAENQDGSHAAKRALAATAPPRVLARASDVGL